MMAWARTPPTIDRVEEVEDIKTCPECHNPVLPARKRRRRTVEDMPAQTRSKRWRTHAAYADPDATRLGARLLRHADQIFTFLDRPEADWHNTFAQRQIRPAVILRKNSQCNRSQRGAATQAVLMSIHRTLKLRGLDPRAAINQALRAYAATGILPPLPTPVEDG